MKPTEPAATRQIARLERAAVILNRFHEELRALAPSLRATRLLRANRAAAEALEKRTAQARTRLQNATAAPAVATEPRPKTPRRIS